MNTLIIGANPTESHIINYSVTISFEELLH